MLEQALTLNMKDKEIMRKYLIEISFDGLELVTQR
jgi:hypothetical protein